MTVEAPDVKAAARAFGIRRRHLLNARVRWERMVLPSLRSPRSLAGGRVLAYHSVGTSEWGINDVPEPLFRSQLRQALDLGYRFVPPEHIAAGLGAEYELAVTFDDGLRSVYENAAPVLAELGIPWSLFVVAEWAADSRQGRLFMGWDEIRQVAGSGASIGSHSMKHPDFSTLTDAAAYLELADSRRVIQERTGVAVDSFAIPFGQSRNWRPELNDLASSAGYRSVYAQAVETRPAGTVARTFITRFDTPRVFRAALEGAFDRWEESL